MSGKDHKETLAYKKERESFLNELQRFHHNRRTPYQVNPSIRGRDVDLYLLYTKVTAAGGWEKVNEEGRWEEFSSLFNLPEGCTHSDQALKRIYIRYLDIYERIHHRGEDPDKQDEYGNQEDGSGGMGGGLTPGARHKRKNPLGGVALKYNYQQHKVPPHLRHNYGLSTELICPSAYAKLEQALLSGLPNEVDFAFNVCTLLSNEGKHTLQLDQCPLILNYMLAHVAICNPDDGLFKLHEDGWKPMTKRNFLRFWYETVEDTEMRNLILPDSLEPKPGEKASTSLASRFYPPLASDSDVEFPDVLNLGRDLGLRDKEGQRVVQLAIILRNLSFEKGNMFVLSNTNVVFRFLLLCMHSNYSNLRQLALDTLSNMALQMVLEPLTKIKTRLILREIGRVIASPDKYEVIGGLDLLARLCQVEENEELLSDGLEQDIYSNIVTYLTVHDIQLIVYTLECLYQLSELGEAAGTHIASAQRAVDTLVSLVTIEAQSYGPESLRGIKVVEHVSVDAAGQPTAPPAPAAPATPARLEERPQAPSPAPQQRPQPVPAGVAPIPTAVAAARAPPATPERTPQGADSDSQCVSWLEAHYEVIDGYMLPRMDLYTDYINACSKSGTMKAVANAVSFANCVRMAFPTLELVKVGKSDGATDFHYRGLRRRPVPRPFGSQVGSRPMNTATPSPPPTQRAITPRQTNTPATATAGESTLIKSLLANKLQQNMQKMQTMSPQQQQSLTTQQPALQQKPSILQQQLQQPPTPQHQLYQQPQQLPQQPVVSQNQMLQQQPIAQPPQQFVQQPMMQQPKQMVQQTIAPQPQQVVQQTAVQQPPQIAQQPQQIVQQTLVQNPQQPMVQQTTVQQPQQPTVQPANAPEAGQGMVEQSSSSTPTSSAQQGSDAAGSSSKQPIPPTETSDPPPSSLPASHSTSTTAIAQTNGPTTIVNGVSSPGSSQPPTPLSLNPEEEEMDIKEYEDSSDKPDDSIQDKKARIKKLMQDTNVIRDNCLNTNGLVCHDSNGGKVKENGQVAEDKQQVLENGCPSPASTPPVNGHNNGELSSSQPVITDTAPVTVNNNATPPTPEPTPELPSNNPCVQHPAAPSHSVANPPNGNAASNPGHPTPNPGGNPAGNPASNPTHNPAPNSVAPPMHNPVSNPVVQSAGVPTVNNPAGLPVGAANSGGNPAVPQGNPIVSQAPGGIPAFVQQQQPQQQQTFIQAPQQYPQVPQQQMPVQQQQIAGEQIVIQQGGQQHVVQLGQPLAQQLAQQPQQQLQQQQQRPMMANGQPMMQQQQQQFVGQQQGMVQPPVAPPPQPQLPPQQILQVQVPPGQQVMQVRMPPSNGQPQILHVHVPQGPGQPPHIMQVSIPPAPNGQAQTVQVQVRPNIAQPPQPARAPLPPYPAHLQQQQQQQIIQQQIPQQPLPQQQLPQQQLPQQLAQQQQLPTSSSSQSGSSVPCSAPQSTPPPSPGQQHPILQQHLQHQQQQQQQAASALSPNSMQRPPTPTGGAGAKRKRPMPPAAAKIAKRTDSADSNQSGASSSTSMPSPALPTLTTLNYMCEWKDCQKPAFESQKECHKHVMCEHFDREQSAFRCMWDGCDGLVRGRWSFVQHLQDRHLCEQALKAAALRRQQQQQLQQQPVAASTGPLSLPPPPVYPNDAALQAIRRFAIKPPYQQFVEAKEGPVTKHIRLTSALILRNLARYSSTGRSLIKQHEQHLAYVAFSAVEASNALSHCLSELQKH